MNFPGKEQERGGRERGRESEGVEGGYDDNDKADRNSQLLHVSRSDRLSNLSTISSFRRALPFPAPGTLSFSQLRSSEEALRGENKSIARMERKTGCKVYIRWEVRNNSVLRRRRGGMSSGVNLAENVEATSRNITIPVTHSSTSCTTPGARGTGDQAGVAVDKAGSERTCKFPRSKKPMPEFRD